MVEIDGKDSLAVYSDRSCSSREFGESIFVNNYLQEWTEHPENFAIHNHKEELVQFAQDLHEEQELNTAKLKR